MTTLRDLGVSAVNVPLPQLGAAEAQHGIEWLNRPGTVGRTWNPLAGCTKVAPGCKHCYAMVMARRNACAAVSAQARGKTLTPKQRAYMAVVKRDKDDGSPLAEWNNRVVLIPEALGEPLKWKKPATVFMSMTDLFHEEVPFEYIDRVLAVMALTPRHTYLILTKRPERAEEYFSDDVGTDGINYRVVMALAEFVGHGKPHAGKGLTSHMRGQDRLFPLPNLWLGCSVSDQKTADGAIPHLLRCPAAVRFVSYEPALGPVDFKQFTTENTEEHRGRQRDGVQGIEPQDRKPQAPSPRPLLDWLIVGGESGPGARPFDVAWGRSAVEQCRAAGVPCFVKQLGKHPYNLDHTAQTKAQSGPLVQAIGLRDPKGGDWSEWPEDLRVREWPKAAEGGAL